jgi:hypothetical protein
LPAAAPAQVVPDDLVDVILGRLPATPTLHDITEDGTVDARDIACLVGNCNPPAVNFVLSTSDQSESAGTIQLQVTASRTATCTVNYTVEGTATSGIDFSPLSGSFALAGTSASVAVTLLDDGILDEELELLVLSIAPATCYRPGAFSQHSLHILDNDRIWYGTLETSGDLLGFQLEVIRTAGGNTVKLVSDGTGTLPPGEWDSTTYSHSETAFALAIEPVTVGGGTTAFATGLERTFSLAALDGSPGQDVQAALVRGTYTETIVPTDASSPHLATTVTGAFTLLEGLPTPSSWEPPLDPSP